METIFTTDVGIEFELIIVDEDGQPRDITGYSKVEFIFKGRYVNTTRFIKTGSVTTANPAVVSYTTDATTFTIADIYQYQALVTMTSGATFKTEIKEVNVSAGL